MVNLDKASGVLCDKVSTTWARVDEMRRAEGERERIARAPSVCEWRPSGARYRALCQACNRLADAALALGWVL